MLPRMMAVLSLTPVSSPWFGVSGTLVHSRARPSLLQAMQGAGGGTRPNTRSQGKKKTVYNPNPHGMKRRSASESSPDEITAIPSDVPPVQLRNDAVWNGKRSSLDWFDNVWNEMDSHRSEGCQLKTSVCRGEAEAIDHKNPFSNTQTEMGRWNYCTGIYHYSGVPLEEARLVYNGRIEPSTHGAELTAQVKNAFQWACKPCNSRKGGVQGNDGNYPIITEVCPVGAGASCQSPWPS